MLRTHTSAHEVEIFKQGYDKWLLTADVYRRDEIDGSHHPVFHQMEGARTFSVDKTTMIALQVENEKLRRKLASTNIIIEDHTMIGSTNPYQGTHNPDHALLVAANLKCHLNSMIYGLFSAGRNGDSEPLRVRWIEAYFPFTSPSYEVEVFFQGKWLEILGCGVVKQRTLDLSGIRYLGSPPFTSIHGDFQIYLTVSHGRSVLALNELQWFCSPFLIFDYSGRVIPASLTSSRKGRFRSSSRTQSTRLAIRTSASGYPRVRRCMKMTSAMLCVMRPEISWKT